MLFDLVYTIFQLPTVSASTVTNCQNSPITSVTAIGSDGNVPSNAIDGNLATRWSNLGIGSWIKLDLGTQQTVCSVDIAWYNGNLRSNNFVISTSVDGKTFANVYSGKSSGTSDARFSCSISEFFISVLNASSGLLVFDLSFLGVYLTSRVFII